jgi:predicted nucleotidyltransferase
VPGVRRIAGADREDGRRALEPLADGVQAAFIYGSIAKGTDKAASDIDLLVVSDRLGYPDLFTALQAAESALGRSISPNVMTLQDWQAKVQEKGSFAARIAAQPRLFVMGSDSDLA